MITGMYHDDNVKQVSVVSGFSSDLYNYTVAYLFQNIILVFILSKFWWLFVYFCGPQNESVLFNLI